MGGGLMQLVAYGAQDIYLTGNPQITFFKVVYRRHTNFAVESIEQTFNGTADFGKRVTATISRNGDLIQQMYLEVVLPSVTQAGAGAFVWTYGIGNCLVKQAEIEIGGQLIDRQYGDWMNIWTELTVPEGRRAGYDSMVGNAVTATTDQSGGLDATACQRLYVPLQFWFNRNPGLALPLIALQYHEVKLNLEIRSYTDLIMNSTDGDIAYAGGTISGSFKLWVDYVYLDTDERRRFAQVSHEYLIEQVQFTGTQTVTTVSNNITLNFNHPVKELIWVNIETDRAKAYSDAIPGSGCWFNYSGTLPDTDPTQSLGSDSFTTGLLQLNGHDRFYMRYSDYFRKNQCYEHHQRVPRVGGTGGKDLSATIEDAVRLSLRQYIYTYSFALSPEEHQPSGTCNFSRIDMAVLQLGYGADPQITGSATVTGLATGFNLNIYAVNYNVLRIMSGMGGLAYSN